MCVMDLACFFFPRHSQWWGITGTAPHCSAPAIPAQPMHSEFLIYNPSSALIKVVFNTLLLFHDCSCSIFTVTPYIWSTLLLQQQGKKKETNSIKSTFGSRESSMWDIQPQRALGAMPCSHLTSCARSERWGWNNVYVSNYLQWVVFFYFLVLLTEFLRRLVKLGKETVQGCYAAPKHHFNSWRFSKPCKETSGPLLRKLFPSKDFWKLSTGIWFCFASERTVSYPQHPDRHRVSDHKYMQKS